jgi:hypothetical protein
VRLTLRTLLAYLDDTLEPSEIKQIGQKVAESDAAQELIARIKQVTRRRRLTTPPLTGPGAKFDPNLIAEYLDNELSGEQVAEIEKICLESDVHLAEIAACHQILTLVLGEPALVPPTARERMYGLVKGREAIPFRKASAKANPNLALISGEDADDTAVLGMPVHKRHASWLKWAIPAAAVLLFIALGVALVSVLGDRKPDNRPDPNKVASGDKPPTDKDDPHKDKPDDKGGTNDKDKPGDKDKSGSDKDKGGDKDKSGSDKDKGGDPKPPDPPVKQPDRVPEPSKERREIATYTGAERSGTPTVLVSRQRGQDTWTRVEPSKPVFSTDSLVSLPGYSSELRFANGTRGGDVRLLLWGTLPELNPGNPFFPFLFESAVTLHHNPDLDLEFTLQRGRVYVSNHADKPALVRVRFEKEVWDLVLQERDTEVVLELLKRYTNDINYQDGEDPRADLSLYVLKGKAGLRFGYHEFPNMEGPTGPALFVWDNKGKPPQEPLFLKEPIPLLKKDLPATTDAAKEIRPALGELADYMTRKKPVAVLLVENADNRALRPSQRAHCIYCLGAIDDVSNLLDILGREDAQDGPQREAVILALRRWIGRGPEMSKVLYVPKKGDQSAAGLLIDKGYLSTGADIVVTLLHDFSDVDRKRRETFDVLVNYLTHSKMAIRELAYFHLKRLAYGAKSMPPPYDPTWDDTRRKKAADEWRAMIGRGELPPPPPMPMSGGPPGPPGPPK